MVIHASVSIEMVRGRLGLRPLAKLTFLAPEILEILLCMSDLTWQHTMAVMLSV